MSAETSEVTSPRRGAATEVFAALVRIVVSPFAGALAGSVVMYAAGWASTTEPDDRHVAGMMSAMYLGCTFGFFLGALIGLLSAMFLRREPLWRQALYMGGGSLLLGLPLAATTGDSALGWGLFAGSAGCAVGFVSLMRRRKRAGQTPERVEAIG